MPTFPSIEWFSAVREAANDGGRLRAAGTCDANVGVKAGERSFRLAFEAFECVAADETDEDGLLDVDFHLELSTEAWRAMLDNIRRNGVADAEHTLNTMDVSGKSGMVKADDEPRRLMFHRYHRSLQAYFDASAGVETTFAGA